MPFNLRRSRKVEPAPFPRNLLDVVKAFYAERREPRYRYRSQEPAVPETVHIRRHAPPQPPPRPPRHHIACLPNELLAHVFELGAADDPMLPVTVSAVCRAWRHLALHTPTLWRTISLDHRLRMWHHRIHRAKACTLDVQLAPRGVMSHLALFNHVQLCMHLVIPHIQRWRSLDIRFTTYAPYLWNAALGACCGHSAAIDAPALRELTLIFPENDDTKEFTLFNGYAPRLRRATLHGIRLTWHPTLFQNLTHLDYTHHGFTRGAQAASEVLYMLQVSPLLESLRLKFPWKGDAASRYALSASFSRAVPLASLRRLTLAADGPDVPPALLYTLPHLALPALRALTLAAPPAQRVRFHAAFPHLRHVLRALPRLPALTRVHVAHAWLDAAFVRALLGALPHPGAPHVALTLEGPHATHALLCDALRAAGRRVRALELVRCDALVAEEVLDVLNRLSGTQLQLVGPGRAQVSGVAALYVHDCAALDWRALRWLGRVGIVLRVWEGGREVSVSEGKRARAHFR